MTILIEAEVAATSVARVAEGSVLYLAPCTVVDRNFILSPSYLSSVESKINQDFETPQKWIIGGWN